MQNDYSLCNLLRVQQLNETGITSGFTFDANDRLNIGVGCVAWNGNNGIMISMSGAYPDGHELFWIRFYNRKLLNTGYSFRYDTMYRADGILSGLKTKRSRKNLTTVYLRLTTTYNLRSSITMVATFRSCRRNR